MAETLIEARDITKRYKVGHTDLNVLNGVDIDIVEGRIMAILGESGAGKSTLLHILGMLDRPTSGSLRFEGKELVGKTDAELATFRNRLVGFIFQFHHLLSEFSALENVQMPAIISGTPKQATRERAVALLEQVGLGERIDHRPGELSGGELQRVAVARALMNEPSIVLADEPSGNLDHRNSEMLHDLMWNLARDHNCSFVVVTHDLSLAKRADSVVTLAEGVLKQESDELP